MLLKLIRTLRSMLVTFLSLAKAWVGKKHKSKPVYHCLWYYTKLKEPKKNGFTLLREFLLLYYHWEFFPHPYFENSMFLRECALSLDEMKQFVPQAIFDREVIKSSGYRFLTEDKALFADLMNHYDIPQPVLICKFHRGFFFDPKNSFMTGEQVDKLISSLDCDRIFLKDSVGAEGAGIHAFDKSGMSGYFENNTKLTSSYLLDNYPQKRLILQEGVIQSAQLASMNPHCLNTVRVLTRYRNGDVMIVAAMLKLGRYQKAVDNVSQGSIMIKVDVDSGCLGTHSRTPYDSEKLYAHPETNVRFEGVKLERWDQVREIVIRTAQSFPDIQFVGWDVAFAKNGVLIIEGNYNPGIIAHQIFGQGLADAVLES